MYDGRYANISPDPNDTNLSKQCLTKLQDKLVVGMTTENALLGKLGRYGKFVQVDATMLNYVGKLIVLELLESKLLQFAL